MIYLLPVVVVLAIIRVILAIKNRKRKALEKPQTIEDKIVALSAQLASGEITKEEYTKKKLKLLQNM